MTSYNAIFDRFKLKIEDMDFLELNDDVQNELMTEWLHSALGLIEAEQIKMVHDLSDYDDEIACFKDDLSNNEIEAMALYMVGIWYEPKVNSLEHTSMFFGSKDEKWNNQKDHLNATSQVQERYFVRARKLFRNYYYKSKLVPVERET